MFEFFFIYTAYKSKRKWDSYRAGSDEWQRGGGGIATAKA
jgi:hypothetical protein